ncbi:histidine phosphatase family protein [Pedobacter frigiditerrae]|uniref:Histidine phosphatase family protein n=1 Tax=Pedobacter frigiditerrae TaxID=2530452 RepID=A0A4V2MIZ3_9SPHI|nr:histidine phosphatase family protein [Pedobacter frigiditerrae]TCC91996.1 histidine phosphatase family protein [Pedobacter frigiditerrae]
MAKQLLLIRHAKSDWGNAGLSDFDRPLNKRGKANAPEMAERLSKKKIVPQQIVSSPALRALTTAKFFADTWQIPLKNIKLKSDIYEASARTLLSVINNLDNQFDKIALFGHNPGLTGLANYFDGNIDNMPTCSAVYIEFPFDDWKMISADTGKVLLFDYPKSGED